MEIRRYGISYTGKMTTLYWIRAQFLCIFTDLGQHLFRYWLILWQHQATTWTIVDLTINNILWHLFLSNVYFNALNNNPQIVVQLCLFMITVTSIRGQRVNTLRPRQNGWHFADICKCFFFWWKYMNLINISHNFVLKGEINNIPALVQLMAWLRPGGKPLSEPMMVSLPTHICFTLPQWVKNCCADMPNIKQCKTVFFLEILCILPAERTFICKHCK